MPWILSSSWKVSKVPNLSRQLDFALIISWIPTNLISTKLKFSCDISFQWLSYSYPQIFWRMVKLYSFHAIESEDKKESNYDYCYWIIYYHVNDSSSTSNTTSHFRISCPVNAFPAYNTYMNGKWTLNLSFKFCN